MVTMTVRIYREIFASSFLSSRKELTFTFVVWFKICFHVKHEYHNPTTIYDGQMELNIYENIIKSEIPDSIVSYLLKTAVTYGSGTGGSRSLFIK